MRKRFRQTSASYVTLVEFLTADLDAITEKMYPICYKAARKKDQDVLERMVKMTDIDKEIRQ